MILWVNPKYIFVTYEDRLEEKLLSVPKMNDTVSLFGFPDEEEQLRYLMPMITEEWLSKRDNWKMIGQCIYNIDDEDYDQFHRYTPESFLEESENLWDSYKHTFHGIRTIRFLAQLLSKETYDEYIEECIRTAAQDALEPTASFTELADIAYYMYSNHFIYTGEDEDTGRKGNWYKFHKHRWQNIGTGGMLKKKFSRHMARIFKDIYDTYDEIIKESVEAGEEADPIALAKLSRCQKIIKGLKTPGYKRSLLEECCEIFEDREFLVRLDENKTTLGWKNGIMDLETKLLRNTYPDDYISLQMGVSYISRFTWESPGVVRIMKYLTQMLHIPDIIDFVIKHKATCMVGGNLDKWFVMYLGPLANNSKTTYQKLDIKTFGDYFMKIPLGTITGKTPEGNAVDPVWASAKGVRLVEVDEGNQKQQLNESILKTRCGNDPYKARKLYSNGTTINPQFSLIFNLNRKPGNGQISSDAAVWEKILTVIFGSRYTRDAPEDPEEQIAQRHYPAIPNVEEVLYEDAAEYAWILVEYLKKYEEEGIKKPESTIEEMKDYMLRNDDFQKFFNDKVIQTNRNTDFIQLDTLYSRYKVWHDEDVPGRTPVPKDEFEFEFSRVLDSVPEGPTKRWFGYKVKSSIKQKNYASNDD